MVCTYAGYVLWSSVVLFILSILWLPFLQDVDWGPLLIMVPVSLIVVCFGFMVVVC